MYISFNPHPTRRPGATFSRSVSVSARKVSILTRPEGRVLRLKFGGDVGGRWFQSSPDPKAGCYSRSAAPWLCCCGFNPHPTRRPGATSQQMGINNRSGKFQSSPDPKAGCYVNVTTTTTTYS